MVVVADVVAVIVVRAGETDRQEQAELSSEAANDRRPAGIVGIARLLRGAPVMAVVETVVVKVETVEVKVEAVTVAVEIKTV